MVSKEGVDAYKETASNTVQQDKLILMLYDGALKFLKIAKENMQLSTYDIANTNILRAQDILTELMFSINLEKGKEIGMNLFHLYAYLKKRLLEANIQKEAAILDEVYALLSQLREAWYEVSVLKKDQSYTLPGSDDPRLWLQG